MTSVDNGAGLARRFRPEDRDQVIALWSRVFPDDPPHNAPGLMLLKKLAVDEMVFVAEQENVIAGACMAGYDGHRGWLYAVAVLPEFRGSGVGRQLVQCASAALKEIGCIKVNIQIRAGNTEVLEFYQRLGFHEEDRISMGLFLE